MGVSDDLDKLAKNQAAMQRTLNALKSRVDTLQQRVSELEGEDYEPEPEPVKETKRVLVNLETRKAPKVEDKPAPKPASKETTKVDENLGFKIFGGVGFFLILLGLFYLYSYAVAQGWISHLGRVVLGVLFCALILAVAEIFRRRKYEQYAQLLNGGGLGLLYFIVSATYYFPAYRQALGMTQLLNSLLLFVVAIIAVYLALRNDSQLLLCFAFLLGFLSAILTGNVHQTMIATLILAACMSYVIARKNWQLTLFPVIASYIVYAVFFLSHRGWSTYGTDAGASFVYLMLFFLIFCALSVLVQAKDDTFNVLAAVLNGAAVLLFGLTIVKLHWNPWRGVFLILIAAAYFGFMALAKWRGSRTMFETFFLLALTFITIAIPVQLHTWQIVIAWAIEGMLLVRTGLRVETKGVRVIGYISLGLSALYMLFWQNGFASGARPLSYIAVIASLYGTSYLLGREQKLDDAQRSMRMALEIVGTVLLTIMFAVETMDPSGLITSASSRTVALVILWCAEALVLLAIGLRAQRKDLEVSGYVVLGLGVLAAYTVGSALHVGPRTLCYAVAVLSLYGGSYLLSREKLDDNQGVMHLLMLVLGLGALNVLFVVDCMDRNGIFGPWSMRVTALTVIWAIEAALLLYLSGRRKELYLEVCGYIALGLCALFAFTFGSSLAAGSRTFCYLLAIIVLYASVRLISDRGESRDTMRGAMVIAGSVLLTVMFAVEVSDASGILEAAGASGRQVALSIVWALEAVVFIVIGFVARSRAFRMMGALLFGIVVVKILLLDLGALEPLYRTIVTMIVGIIALGAAFAYVKNKEKIQQFLKEK